VPNVPILRSAPQLQGGQEYAILLSTADGEEHIMCVVFNTPTNDDGSVNLDMLKNFKPEVHFAAIIRLDIAFAQRLPIQPPPKWEPHLSFEVEGGTHVMPAQVVSFRYLGPVDSRDAAAEVLRVRQTLAGGKTGIVRYGYGPLQTVESQPA